MGLARNSHTWFQWRSRVQGLGRWTRSRFDSHALQPRRPRDHGTERQRTCPESFHVACGRDSHVCRPAEELCASCKPRRPRPRLIHLSGPYGTHHPGMTANRPSYSLRISNRTIAVGVELISLLPRSVLQLLSFRFSSHAILEIRYGPLNASQGLVKE